MKRMAAPNSPDKKHFMVEVSPYFTKLASSRDTDQLLAMLPYKSLHLSSVKDRFGIYALIDKNENRDKNIRKPRASIRKQLSETKQAASLKSSGPQKTVRNGGLTMNFSVEEENLICMYHTSDRRRTMARMLAALPDMDTEMRWLANGPIAKLEHMTDADFDGQRFDFTGE